METTERTTAGDGNIVLNKGRVYPRFGVTALVPAFHEKAPRISKDLRFENQQPGQFALDDVHEFGIERQPCLLKALCLGDHFVGEVFAVIAPGHLLGEGFQLLKRQKPATEGGFLRAADFNALPLFDGLHVS